MSWKEIYKNLNPMEPLQPEDHRLTIELFSNYINDVADLIALGKERQQKILFSGNIGCGKSTFLNLLAEHPQIKKEFLIVKYSLQDIVDPGDASHIDILLSITLQSFATVVKSTKIKVDKKLIEQVQTLAHTIMGLIEKDLEPTKSRTGSAEVSAGVSLPKFIDWIQAAINARYKVERETREKIREHYRPRMTDFLNLINDVLDQIQASLAGTSILILIDDADKIPPEQAMKIFFENGQHFSYINANILFVVDTSISCSRKYTIIINKIGKEEFFPALKLIERNGSRSQICQANIELLKQLTFKRIPAAFIEDAALDHAIELSGGVVREFIRILQESIFFAKGKIFTWHVDSAAVSIRNKYNLYGQHTRLLKKILENPLWLRETAEDVTQYEEIMRLLLWMPALF
ncbi:hypothetical protein L0128_05150 [candidate division KSB1 bacterium]|nr:hypothetical protein [candidate division KSB1 bacterium]